MYDYYVPSPGLPIAGSLLMGLARRLVYGPYEYTTYPAPAVNQGQRGEPNPLPTYAQRPVDTIPAAAPSPQVAPVIAKPVVAKEVTPAASVFQTAKDAVQKVGQSVSTTTSRVFRTAKKLVTSGNLSI